MQRRYAADLIVIGRGKHTPLRLNGTSAISSRAYHASAYASSRTNLCRLSQDTRDASLEVLSPKLYHFTDYPLGRDCAKTGTTVRTLPAGLFAGPEDAA